MHLFWLATILVGIAVFGCSDGKLNLLLVLWDDPDPKSSSSYERHSSSSIEISSSSTEEELSSSSEEEISSSSEEEPSSSSSEEVLSSSSSEEPPPSSSSRGQRYSSAKMKDGYHVEDYPTLEEGAPGVMRANPGGVTRYWDGCKPSCAYVAEVCRSTGSRCINNKFPNPYGVGRVCDINGNQIPLHYRQPPEAQTHAVFLGTPNACQPHDIADWQKSGTYAELKALNPNFPTGIKSAGYICSADQIPYAVNDTLAYAFVASEAGCGKCFQLQFRPEFHFDDAPRPPHIAIAGKTLIVMVNNFGVIEGSFDIMIPGGGVGDNKILLETLDLPRNRVGESDYLGRESGGLLAECTFGTRDPTKSFTELDIGFGGMIERYSLAEVQECLRAKCNRAFKNYPVLLKGCLWHADWFMAVDNPEVYYKEVECPQYLVDRYVSSFSPFHALPEDLLPNAHCEIEGGLQCGP